MGNCCLEEKFCHLLESFYFNYTFINDFEPLPFLEIPPPVTTSPSVLFLWIDDYALDPGLELPALPIITP